MRLFSKKRKDAVEPAKPDLATQFPDVPDFVLSVMEKVSEKTMTSLQRIISLCDVVSHVSKQQIQGSIVECGVWRGGSMMAAALTLCRGLDQLRRAVQVSFTVESLSGYFEAYFMVSAENRSRF